MLQGVVTRASPSDAATLLLQYTGKVTCIQRVSHLNRPHLRPHGVHIYCSQILCAHTPLESEQSTSKSQIGPVPWPNWADPGALKAVPQFNCRHTTVASFKSHRSSHTVLHKPSWSISTLPKQRVDPDPTNRIWASIRNTRHKLNKYSKYEVIYKEYKLNTIRLYASHPRTDWPAAGEVEVKRKEAIERREQWYGWKVLKYKCVVFWIPLKIKKMFRLKMKSSLWETSCSYQTVKLL